MPISREEMWRIAEEASKRADQIPPGSRAVIDAKYAELDEKAARREELRRYREATSRRE